MPKTKPTFLDRHRDKLAHLGLTGLSAVLLAGGIHYCRPVLPIVWPISAAAGIVLAACVVKEIIDARRPNGTGFSWPDMGANALGVALGCLAAWLNAY